MNDDFVKCAGEALIMQYALVNTDSLIGVLDRLSSENPASLVQDSKSSNSIDYTN